MVCLVTPVEKESQEYYVGKYLDDAMTDGNEDDQLKVRRLAGGSIVDHPPLFSPDGEVLFTIFKTAVQVYSTATGEWIRDLEGNGAELVAIHFPLDSSKILAGMTAIGELIRWKWKSGSVESRQTLPLKQSAVHSFHFVDLLPDSAAVFVTYSSGYHRNIEWAAFDTTNGERLDVSGNLELRRGHLKIDAENVHFHYVASIQNFFLTIQNYKDGRTKKWKNANQVPFTVVRAHPKEEMVATGDEMGRIFLWRNIYGSRQPWTTLYHWHHTAVTSIAFTISGTGFYSGGQESVLVQWNIDRPDLKNFLPRMHAMILHIVVGQDNRKVAVCTADNGIQILDSQNQAKCMLQGFTYVYNDKTGLDKFPIGMKLNPKTNCIALNGRIGHIQFYSTYTRRLLYNMDIVMQNQLSIEAGKILYNIRVVAAAFNVDWMATVEEWNDQEHSPEIRLKFWQFDKKSQGYTLNTNVEGPHDEGVKATEFSSAMETENLLCATAGCDSYIKMWALEESDNIYRKGKVWFCIARTNYKQFNLECMSFSHDGSLIAAGFQNTLCIYKSQSLALKAALSVPGRLTGTVHQVNIQMPKVILKNSRQNNNGNKKHEIVERRKRILEQFKSFFDGHDEKLIQELKKTEHISKKRNEKDPIEPVDRDRLDSGQQEYLFEKIRSLIDLSLFQKIDLYQKLGIYCSVSKESKRRIAIYIARNILSKDNIECSLDKSIQNINSRHRFKAKYRMYKYLSRKTKQDEEKLIPVMDLLSLNDYPDGNKYSSHNDRQKMNSSSSHCNGYIGNDVEMKEASEVVENLSKPVETVANIRHVAFATGEHAHLIVACTEHRVLIWNILTLRLQAMLKISVSKMTLDPLTSLVAAFTIDNDLYVFSPNAPMPLYHRVNMPEIFDALWVPRRYPKSNSLSVDWQAMSTLYFLTKDQELVYLAADKDNDVILATAFTNEAQDVIKYSTFGTFAAKQENARLTNSTQYNIAIGVPGKAAVKSFIEMASHTMAPTHLLCTDFIESMLKKDADQKTLPHLNSADADANQAKNASERDDSDDENQRNKSKQFTLDQSTMDQNAKEDYNRTKQIKQREKLKNILREEIEIKF